MNKIYNFLFLLSIIIGGCKYMEIDEKKVSQSINSLNMNIYSNQGVKVLSIKRLNIPVKETPITNEIQNGKPLSTASELIIPAPTTAKAGCAKLRTSIDL